MVDKTQGQYRCQADTIVSRGWRWSSHCAVTQQCAVASSHSTDLENQWGIVWYSDHLAIDGEEEFLRRGQGEDAGYIPDVVRVRGTSQRLRK